MISILSSRTEQPFSTPSRLMSPIRLRQASNIGGGRISSAAIMRPANWLRSSPVIAANASG
jgi:hypothetical protein